MTIAVWPRRCFVVDANRCMHACMHWLRKNGSVCETPDLHTPGSKDPDRCITYTNDIAHPSLAVATATTVVVVVVVGIVVYRYIKSVSEGGDTVQPQRGETSERDEVGGDACATHSNASTCARAGDDTIYYSEVYHRHIVDNIYILPCVKKKDLLKFYVIFIKKFLFYLWILYITLQIL